MTVNPLTFEYTGEDIKSTIFRKEFASTQTSYKAGYADTQFTRCKTWTCIDVSKSQQWLEHNAVKTQF